MIIILKRGDPDKLKKYKMFKCDKCDCEFIADNKEYSNISTQRDGPLFQIPCPTCANWVYNNSYEYVDPPKREET